MSGRDAPSLRHLTLRPRFVREVVFGSPPQAGSQRRHPGLDNFLRDRVDWSPASPRQKQEDWGTAGREIAIYR